MNYIDKETILESITLTQALAYDGIEIKRNRTACMFCNASRGDTLKVEEPVFFCHKCNAKGNVINYWMNTRHLSFPAAIDNLASAFGLSVEGISSEEMNNIRLAREEKKRQKEQKEREKALLRKRLDVKYDAILKWYKEKAFVEPFSPHPQYKRAEYLLYVIGDILDKMFDRNKDIQEWAYGVGSKIMLGELDYESNPNVKIRAEL